MTRILGAWLSQPGTQSVIQVLEMAGYEARFVGGCVRNAVLGKHVNDIDIATSAKPEQTQQVAKAAGLSAIPTGIDHGTITVVAQGISHEVTTYRQDVETDGRHARVKFSTDISVDAARRDFTMNALYADSDGNVIDPIGGLADLRVGRLRFVGNAKDRIREDHLRSLRFFRFAAWYADPAQGFDPDALDAIARQLDGLGGLSRERVGAEIVKLMTAPDPAPAVHAMSKTGVLAHVLPGATESVLAQLIHLEGLANAVPDALRRLAVMGWTDAQALRLSRRDGRRLQQISTNAQSTQTPEELGFFHGVQAAKDALLMRAVSVGAPWNSQHMERARAASEAKFPISASDLMPVYLGQALGDRLRQLQKIWLASRMTLDRTTLLDARQTD